MDYSSLIRDYLDDAGAHLGAFDGVLLTLEKEGLNRGLIQDALGSLHTLKGNSGMMGFEHLKSYIHQVEGILKAVLDDRVAISGVIEPLLESANVIRNALSAIEKDDPDSQTNLIEHAKRLREAVEGNGSGGYKAFSLSNYLGSKTDTIKVDFKRLDALLNLVGELVIFKTRMNQIGERVKQHLTVSAGGQAASHAGGAAAHKPLSREMSEGLQLVGKTVSELQEGIMKIRMLPVKTVFSKFPRMVRDIASSQGKDVSIAFEGEDTELDKTVIDELGEPLLHIIRNAVDHGIETREERIRAGKNPTGRLVISAAQESNFVIIRVSDDGRGIDPENIREKAAKQGLISMDSSLSREDILNLIFAPGFTTKEETSDISGRGIGLDVVSRNIFKLNGQTLVESASGKGSSFTLKLPLSLAIIPALMAETSGEVFAVPMSSVEESVKVKESDIHLVNGREVVRLREQVLPVVRLNRFFNLEERNYKRLYLVIVRKGDRRLAAVVDRLRGRQEIVIKPLDETLGKSAGIAGASILGDGRVVLIIDTNELWTTTKGTKEAGDE